MRSYGSCPAAPSSSSISSQKNLVSSIDREQIPKMNQSITIDLTDTTCSRCHCEDQTFLHKVLKGGSQSCKICPSCVLFEHIEFYCPECFDLHDDTGEVICCCVCRSNTHRKCLSDEEDVNKFRCSTCKHPERLIFDLKESKAVKPGEDKGTCKLVDFQAARLLLTSASIVKKLMSKAYDEAINTAMVRANEAVLYREMAIDAVSRFEKCKESNDGPSLLDSSSHET